MINRLFQRLDQRLSGIPADDTLHDGVAEWLERPLREWLVGTVGHDPDTSKRVLLRLRRSVQHRSNYQSTIINVPSQDLLITIDAVLQLHPGWEWRSQGYGNDYGTSEWMVFTLKDLEQILVDGGSLYTLDWENRCLTRRVDATATEAFENAIKDADGTTAEHLRAAWVAAYGLSPDPDKVFNEAIRAVEEVACPLVMEKSAERNKATLGGVIGVLKGAGHKWEVDLPEGTGQPQTADRLVGMLEMLWAGQISRHGGGANSRRQTQTEAEAAVQLAVLIAQWMQTGVLRKKA